MLLWLAVHLFYLPGLRSRLAALASWGAGLAGAGDGGPTARTPRHAG